MECLVYFQVKPPAGLTQKKINKIVIAILQELKKNQAEVSVHLIGTIKMKQLNQLYRGQAKVTDVLAFATDEGEPIVQINEGGDIFICLPQIIKQAKLYKVNWAEELIRMLAHGVLHLFAFDHQTKKQAKQMFAVQEKIVANFKLKI